MAVATMSATTDDAVAYYRRVAKWMLPHLKNVPVSFKRFPGTVRDESFWEKDAPSFTPKWVKTFAVPRKSDESDIRYILINDVKTLAWVIRQLKRSVCVPIQFVM